MLESAQRVQAALLPVELPKRMRHVDVAARLEPARGLGGDFYDFLAPEPNSLVVAVGDVSGKGVPAALYERFVQRDEENDASMWIWLTGAAVLSLPAALRLL